ncbi:hypothetical protein QAZ01_11030, partial [Glaesserella parasuis]|uniref:hypothetical protein n=1 Tax=Glaesserella parasuis TaxID=738 RepID=UPI0024371DCD
FFCCFACFLFLGFAVGNLHVDIRANRRLRLAAFAFSSINLYVFSKALKKTKNLRKRVDYNYNQLLYLPL